MDRTKKPAKETSFFAGKHWIWLPQAVSNMECADPQWANCLGQAGVEHEKRSSVSRAGAFYLISQIKDKVAGGLLDVFQVSDSLNLLGDILKSAVMGEQQRFQAAMADQFHETIYAVGMDPGMQKRVSQTGIKGRFMG